jgi:signal transduction histidine kinase
MKGTRWAIRPATNATSRDKRSSLATTTLHFVAFAAASAAADTGGTGMGLSIVQAVMTSHGGSIRLLPTNQGVGFELQFPAA